MDAAVVPDAHGQRRPARTSCARLQSRQFPADADDAGADQDGSLTTLKEKLIKIGAKVLSHGRYIASQMADVAIARNLFADILRMIGQLRPPPTASIA